MSVMVVGVMIIIAGIVVMSIIGQRRYEQNVHKPVKGDDLPVWPFVPMPLMTDTEVLFFHKLKQAVPEYLIFSQVQLSRVIEASDEADSKRFWFNRICRQSIDYVVVAADAQTVLLAIELDDWTHKGENRQRADDKKDKALASAGIPILRYHAEKMPNAVIIREDIGSIIETYWQVD